MDTGLRQCAYKFGHFGPGMLHIMPDFMCLKLWIYKVT